MSLNAKVWAMAGWIVLRCVDQPFYFYFIFLFYKFDHLAIEQALNFSIVTIMLSLKLIFLATMLTKFYTFGY